MKVVLAGLILIAAAMARAECSQHDPRSQDGLLAVENRWVKALDDRDQSALACILAPEFTDAGIYGQIREGAKVLADLPRRRGAAQHLEQLEALIIGNAGVVRGVNHLTGPDQVSLVDVRFTDVFAYREGRWQAISAQETLVKKQRPTK